MPFFIDFLPLVNWVRVNRTTFLNTYLVFTMYLQYYTPVCMKTDIHWTVQLNTKKFTLACRHAEQVESQNKFFLHNPRHFHTTGFFKATKKFFALIGKRPKQYLLLHEACHLDLHVYFLKSDLLLWVRWRYNNMAYYKIWHT